MTPERAEAIAQVIADSLATGEASNIGVSWSEAIAEAILLACAEQREIDAKIAANFYGAIGFSIAKAIRGGA